MLDALFRPQLAIQQPTFRIDNSAALEAIGVKTRGKRDRYSYADIEPGREKLGELAQSYQSIDPKKRDPLQNQVVDLAANLQTYESLLGYFSFARSGVILRGSGENGAPDKRADVSALMATAPQLRAQIDQSQAHGGQIEPRLRDLLEQVLDASNFAKFGLFIIPPADAKNPAWQSAGNVIMDVMSGAAKDPRIRDRRHQGAWNPRHGRSAGMRPRSARNSLPSTTASSKRAQARGEYDRIELEAILLSEELVSLCADLFSHRHPCGAGHVGDRQDRRSAGCSHGSLLGSTLAGLGYCIIAIVKRCIIMQRPPVGNLYDTIIFIATTVVLFSLIVEWMVRRRFALGIAPILGTALIVLARRFELGDAKDHMDPLVAVLDSNFWLTIHVITITLGYSAGLLSAFLSAGYVLLRGLGLDGGDQGLRRSLTRAVYGMLCFTLFLSLDRHRARRHLGELFVGPLLGLGSQGKWRSAHRALDARDSSRPPRRLPARVGAPFRLDLHRHRRHVFMVACEFPRSRPSQLRIHRGQEHDLGVLCRHVRDPGFRFHRGIRGKGCQYTGPAVSLVIWATCGPQRCGPAVSRIWRKRGKIF